MDSEAKWFPEGSLADLPDIEADRDAWHRWATARALRGADGFLCDSPAVLARARRLLAAKYQGWKEGKPMSGWATTALPVAIDLQAREAVR